MRERKRTTAKSKRLEKPPVVAIPIPPVLAVATPTFGVPVTPGSIDASDWMKLLDIRATDLHWFVEVVLSVGEETRFHLYIYPQEWSFLFCHAGQGSWIRIADRAYVHGRDDYALLASAPPLRELSAFLGELERRHRIVFERDRVAVRTNVDEIDERVRAWAAQL